MRRTFYAVAVLALAACGTPDPLIPPDPTLLDGTFSLWGGEGGSSADSTPTGWVVSPSTAWHNTVTPLLGRKLGTGGVAVVGGASVVLTLSETLTVTPGHTYRFVLDGQPLDDADKGPGKIVMAVDWLDASCREALDTYALTSTATADSTYSYTAENVAAPSSTGCARVRLLLSGGTSGVFVREASIQEPRS